MKTLAIYRNEIKIFKFKYISCYLYYMNPGGVEKPHFHDGIEIEYVLSGTCQTHKQGRVYFRKRGKVHEGINNSGSELVFLNITIPAETPAITHYVKSENHK